MKRRGALLIAIMITMAMLISCTSKATFTSPCSSLDSGEEVTFMIISDPHYISKSTYDLNKAFEDFCCTCDGKLLQYTDEIMDVIIWQIEEDPPDFLIVSGDLTCNGEKDSHVHLAEKLKKIEDNGTCVFVIPGNHDIENPWARNYIGEEASIAETVDVEGFLEIYHDFGYEESISKDEDSVSYLVTPSEDIWLLMLDSTKREESRSSKTPIEGGKLSSKTLDWIEQCGEKAKASNARLIASMHHNLLRHNPNIYEGYTIDNAQEALEVFRKCNIEILLSGHIHLQDIKTQITDQYRVDDIATGSLVAFPNKYGELKFHKDHGYDYQSRRIHIEEWAKENHIKDDNLMGFNHYSRKFFEDHSYNKYYNSIINTENITEANFEFILQAVSKLNAEYFDGFRNEALYGSVDIDRLKGELDNLSDSLKNYLNIMMNDQYTDNNKISIPIAD